MRTLSEKHAAAIEEKRGISCETAARMGLVSNGTAIGFTYRDRSQPLFVKWRDKDKRFWIEPSGQRLQLWNLDSLRDGSSPEMVIITEGEFDALSWIEAGATHVVSVPNGARQKVGEGDIVPEEDDAFAYLWNGNQLIPELLNAKKIILSTDADQPGRVLAEELAIRLGRERCWLVEYPDGCKDANDVLVKHGPEAVTDLLATAKSLWPTELVPITELPDNPLSVPNSTGWTGFDFNFKFVPPELIIMTGLPNAGKSQFAWALGCQMARVAQWKVAIIQFEDGSSRIKDTITNYAIAYNIPQPLKWAAHYFRAPKPDDAEDIEASDRTMRWVLDRVKEAGMRHGCRLVIIDPWNEIEHDWGRQYTETQYISRMLKLLKQSARRYSLAIILIAHPKVSHHKETIEDLDLNCVAGGMAWNAKADHGIVLARHPVNEGEIYVKVSKSRDQRNMGVPGICRFRYDRRNCTYAFVGKGVD